MNYKDIALSLAKNSILEEFGNINAHKKLQNLKDLILTKKIKPLIEKKASFVTLKLNGKDLRGCIGSLIPIKSLYEDIILNAKNAAFSDPRFDPLTLKEIDNLYLEISILTLPQPLKVSSVDQLLRFLATHKPGLIIKLDDYQATFLPSVWTQLPNPHQFLTHLILKAGMDPNYFLVNFSRAEIYYYFSEEFGKWWKDIN